MITKKYATKISAHTLRSQIIKKIDSSIQIRRKDFLKKDWRRRIDILKSAKNSQEMFFYFNVCSRSDLKDLQKVIEAFKMLIVVQFISFRTTYIWFKAMNASLNLISKSVKNFKYLKRLELSLKIFNELTDIGLYHFSKCLKRSVSLQKIILDFPNCWIITDKGLARLSKSLRRLPLLQNVFFFFFHCSKITDEGLQDLAQSLGQLVCLQSVFLNFDYCYGATDKGIPSLCETIDKLACPQKISMSFKNCTNITDRGGQKVNGACLGCPL